MKQFFDLDPVEKAVWSFLPSSGGTATLKAVTYNLNLTEEEALQGLNGLVVKGLADHSYHQDRATTYFLTDSGIQQRMLPRRTRALPG